MAGDARRSPSGDRIAGGVLLVGAALAYALTFDFPDGIEAGDPGPAALPRIVTVALALLALALLWRPVEGEPLPRGAAALRTGGVALMLCLYAATLEPLGFVLTTTLFLLVVQRLAGVRGLGYSLGVPPALSLALYYLFDRLLEVPLPRTWLERLLP